jgi:tripartite-type tricarboxylate transporter receptor subunit TctC
LGADTTGPLVIGKKALIVIQLNGVLSAEITGKFDTELKKLLKDPRWAEKAKRVGTIITDQP